jgi:cobalt-zinc-cadmium efflux system outer membrane protein
MPYRTTAASVRPPFAHRIGALLAMLLLAPAALSAQTPLSLDDARRLARQQSPVVAAARAAVEAAAARERQAAVWTNPTLSYSREQAGGNAQDIAAVEQRIEIGGQRGSRVAAARLRREAAQARLAAVEATVDLDITRAFTAVLAAERGLQLASAAAAQFRTASATMNRRLQEGDISSYEASRVHLESARYQAFAAEATLVRDDARLRLQSLLGRAGDTLLAALAASPETDAALSLPRDSLIALALARNAELQAMTLDARAAEADAALATRERVPSPALSGGLKREAFADDPSATGFVLGLSVPLPLWDRRAGAIAAANAESRRLAAERDIAARRTAQETAAALEAVRQLDAQVAALRTVLGAESAAALRAAETAYMEGEITLVEWLDAVRAYQEAELAFANVLSQAIIQRAVLERLLGTALIR